MERTVTGQNGPISHFPSRSFGRNPEFSRTSRSHATFLHNFLNIGLECESHRQLHLSSPIGGGGGGLGEGGPVEQTGRHPEGASRLPPAGGEDEDRRRVPEIASGIALLKRKATRRGQSEAAPALGGEIGNGMKGTIDGI